MKIKWLGHAAFVISSIKGMKIFTDPYAPDERLSYGEINEPADIVTVSHDHSDHNNVVAVSGNPEIVREASDVKGIKFDSVLVSHDDAQGKERGSNTIFCFDIDEIRICHLGDLGHKLSENQIAQVGKVDVLLIPVGGFYTIDAATATRVCNQTKPKIIIPMHFKNSKCDFPISGVDEFLKGKPNVRQLDTSEVEFQARELPDNTEIIVLKSAL